MIRKITFLLLACLGFQYAAQAQYCGFDVKNQHMMSANPAYAAAVNQFNSQWSSYLAAQMNPNALLVTLPNGDTVFQIPIVVHVIHTGGSLGSPYNPSTASILSMVDYLNKTWDASWPFYPSATTGGTRIPVQFVLAQRDPNCATTTGIERIDGSSLSGYTANGVLHNGSVGAAEGSVKALSDWPNTDYVNIWIVNKIDGADGTGPTAFVAGYAYLPPAPPALDGIIMLASQVGPGAITLPHEMGHFFNLYHTFQGGCSASSTAPGCTSGGDFCCDTEPMAQGDPALCSDTNSCTNLPFLLNTQHNMMNYSNCQNRFTVNQRDRVLLTLKTLRPSLISSLGATALPPASLPVVCVPTYLHTSSPQDAGPREVKITSGTNPLLDITSGGYVTEGNRVYIDNTCKQMVTLKAGQTYTISIQTSGSNDIAKAYIDYNNDGVLGNSNGETIALGSGNPHTATFTVPITSNVLNCTRIRMRIVSDIAATVDSCSPLNYGQAEDYSAIIQGGGSAGGTVTVPNPPAGGNPSCIGTTLTFSSIPGNGAIPAHYRWYKKNGAVITNGPDCDACSTWTSNTFADLDSVYVKMIYLSSCGTDSVFSNKVRVIRVTTVPPVVTIGLTYGVNPSCTDDSLSVTVTGNVNPGGAPTYQWKVNGVNSGGLTTNPFFNATNLLSGSVVSVVMTSSAGAPCAIPSTATSNNVTITHTTKAPTLTIALINGTNPGCPGQMLTFRETSTVGGLTPSYQWYVNSSAVFGATGTTFAGVFNNNDVISCTMISSTPCAVPNTANSNTIVVTHQKMTANITIAQVLGTNPGCSGHLLGFSATTTNAGANPQFQWILNGNLLNGANGPLFATDSFKDNDMIGCILIATDPCVNNPLDTSNVIKLSVNQSLVPSISVVISSGKNPGCLDSLIQFTAATANLGNSPNYIWFVNGIPVYSGTSFSTSSLLNGDIIICQANQTDGKCYLPDTILSVPDTMVRTLTPSAPTIHLIGNMLTTLQGGTFIWFGPHGAQNTGGSNGQYYPTQLGDYYAVRDSNGCWSKPSNILTLTLLDVTSINLDDMKIYPNPTSGEVTLDWGTKAVNMDIEVMNPLGQHMLHDEMRGQSHKIINLKGLANGMYYIVVKDEQGKMGTVKVTLAK